MATAPARDPHQRRTEIEVRRDPSAPDGVRFSFQDSPERSHAQQYDNDGRPGHLIKFVISDPDGTGLRFPRDRGRALWVHPVDHESAECPPEGSRWDEFTATAVTENGTTLIVRNLNSYEQLFKFSLNFTRDRDNPGAALVIWDPIGDNRNGNRQA